MWGGAGSCICGLVWRAWGDTKKLHVLAGHLPIVFVRASDAIEIVDSTGVVCLTDRTQYEPAPLGAVARRLGKAVAEGRLGFLAAAMTPWHAIGVDAWVRHLRDRGEDRPGAVVMLPHFRDGLGIDASKFPLSLADGGVGMHPVSTSLATSRTARVGQILTTAGRLAGLWASRPGPAGRPGAPSLAIGSPGYAAAGVFLLTQLCNLRTARGADVRFVLLDEGIGTYVSRTVGDIARKGDRPKQGRIVGGAVTDDLLYRIWKRGQDAVARGYPRESRFAFAMGEATGRLVANEPVAEEYRRVIHAVGDGIYAMDRTAKPVALILPQPWAEAPTSQAEGGREMNLLIRVAARLDERGYDVRLKPHPRERAGKYDQAIASGGAKFQLMPAGQAAEFVFERLRPGDVVIGYNTSALMTARLLFGLGTYTLSGLLAETTDVGEWFSAAQEAFETLAGPSVAPFEDEFGQP